MSEKIRPIMMLIGQVIFAIVSLGTFAIAFVTDSILMVSNAVRR